jgi:hypothetical protein
MMRVDGAGRSGKPDALEGMMSDEYAEDQRPCKELPPLPDLTPEQATEAANRMNDGHEWSIRIRREEQVRDLMQQLAEAEAENHRD